MLTPAERALLEFVETIDTLGGVFLASDGEHRPVGDPDWSDLGRAYMQACEALGQDPKISTLEYSFDPDA
jgi:hypothetical protein